MAISEPIVIAETGAPEQLARTWQQPPGFWGWFKNVHHTAIGVRFMVTSFIFFLLGGVLAAMMRWQLARPEHGAIGPDLYNQIFTVHGSTMIFLFAVPMMFQGFGVYLVPLICGTRNIAFPRLNAFSYYIYLVGGLLLWVGLLLKTGADAGWFAYVPLSGPQFTPGKRSDFWAQMITFTEVSALGVAICIATTILRFRAPGMTLNRMPIILWEKLVISIAVIFAMPAVMVVSSMLLMDRTINTQFFNPAVGGDVLLYQHLFWFFGHPEVYIIFLPGTAIVSTLVPVFSRRHIFGYTAIVTAVVATGFLGFGVWVHHMFATGLPQMSASFFTAASLMIVIPTATQFYCWLATLWHGRLQLKLPMLWILGFFFVFLIGGLSGVMLASVPVDWQVHDTFFVVAHFHYVLIGGALFPMFGGLYFWIPKITGRMMNDLLGKIHFWLFFVGFNLTFFTMHFLGLRGMPRRVYTYLPEMHWGALNTIASSGVLLMTAGIIIFLVNFFQSKATGEPAGSNPWYAGTLEWATPSPPPHYNFLQLPTVNGREALWDALPNQPIVGGVREDIPEVLVTNSLDSEPQFREELPGPSIWPFLTSITVSIAFIWSIFSPWGIAYGAIPVVITLVGWLWPRGHSPSPSVRHRSEVRWSR
ncbi:MAG TPA: cytochrome c oxidase subunit I [Terriglobales bacterium]|nr:cytochrome c oxidase subunit I [Terriglobales bacterium]